MVTFLITFTICAITTPVLTQTNHCEDNLAWAETTPNLPHVGDSACTTWSSYPEEENSATFIPVWNSTTQKGELFLADMANTTTNLQVGGGGGPEFGTSNAIAFIGFSINLKAKHHGTIIELSNNDGEWTDITSIPGATLSPSYNYLMTGGPLAGNLAYSGSIHGTIKADIRKTTLTGTIKFRVHYGSDEISPATNGGVHITSFSYWENALSVPSADIYADTGYIYGTFSSGEDDPRVSYTKAWDNETDIGQVTTLPVQREATGPHQWKVVNYDTEGNPSPPGYSCTITPMDTGYTGMTLALVVKAGTDLKITWTANSDFAWLYKSGNPADLHVFGGGTLIGSWNPSYGEKAIRDVGALLNTDTDYYLLVVEVGGNYERVPAVVQLCTLLN
jgi:hypothetical protein